MIEDVGSNVGFFSNDGSLDGDTDGKLGCAVEPMFGCELGLPFATLPSTTVGD